MAVAHSLCSAPKYVHYTHTREKEKKKYRIFYRATLNGFLFICFIRLHRIHLFIDRMCVVVFFVLRAILFDKYDLKRWCTSILFYMILCSCWCCCWLVFLCVFIHSLSIRFIVLAYRRLLRFFFKRLSREFHFDYFRLIRCVERFIEPPNQNTYRMGLRTFTSFHNYNLTQNEVLSFRSL